MTCRRCFSLSDKIFSEKVSHRRRYIAFIDAIVGKA